MLKCDKEMVKIDNLIQALARSKETERGFVEVYIGLAELSSFYLCSLQFSSLGDNTFNKMSNLTQIIIVSNQIEHLCANVFQRLKNLKCLLLNENKINNLSFGIFQELINLEVLDLAGNKNELKLLNLKFY